jgi:hypothetical protein
LFTPTVRHEADAAEAQDQFSSQLPSSGKMQVNRALIEAAVTRLSDCDGLNSERMAHLGRHPPDRTGVFARREVLVGKI